MSGIGQPTGPLWVCVDCIVLHCTGDLPADPAPGAPAPLSAIGAGYDITAGMLREHHAPDCAPDDDCDCETDAFSWQSCDGCGSPLAGERHALTLWARPGVVTG